MNIQKDIYTTVYIFGLEYFFYQIM